MPEHGDIIPLLAYMALTFVLAIVGLVLRCFPTTRRVGGITCLLAIMLDLPLMIAPDNWRGTLILTTPACLAVLGLLIRRKLVPVTRGFDLLPSKSR